MTTDNMTSKDIRKAFLEFFAQKEHQIVSSAPMLVKNDPTLMFTNAGMNQFKDIFLGNSPIVSPRVADSQKCLRVSGKHNDLEEVGHDTYHHTMFEMLGNWSFGDYFKKEVIAFAWELLTERFKISKEDLYVTVFGGDEKDGTSKDMEAYEFWKEHISADRILFGSKKDNFWEMGETGPCGPCSEIHVDIRSPKEKQEIPGKDLVNKDHPQLIEIWNLVFMQYNRKADGSLEELPNKHVDTGMGFERLCMVLQGKQSNYDTDVFMPLIDKISSLSGIEYGKDAKKDIAMRVIADHLRAVSFAIADGQLPSNNKAGYVIRRILRRAVRYGYTFLNFRDAFMCRLVDTLSLQMGEAFPELKQQKTLIEKVVEEEENAFLRTLDTGIKLLGNIAAKAKEEKSQKISGKDAFTLYDTYGFPIDLTNLILKEDGLEVEMSEFETCLKQQKERSRNDAEQKSDDWVVLKEGETEFLGYDSLEAQSKLLKYRKISKKGKVLYQLVFEQTPFYAESGGQIGDKGFIETQDGEKIEILDTQKENKLNIHISSVLPQNTTALFSLKVNKAARIAAACHHTSTHLMHYALREVLGSHVEQKGSLVSDKMLRFDFSHFQKLSEEEIRKVELLVNDLIRQNISLDEHRSIPIEEAKAMGAMALFSEKYGDSVRVVKYGPSVELCGGTHIASTGQIGLFKIISEGAVAAGVRRIEAIAAAEAMNYMLSVCDSMQAIRTELKLSGDILSGIKKLSESNIKLKKEIEQLSQEKLNSILEKYLGNKTNVASVPYIYIRENLSADMARNLCMNLRKSFSDGIALLLSHIEGKNYVYVYIGEKILDKNLDARAILKELGSKFGAAGGGQNFLSTASWQGEERRLNEVEPLFKEQIEKLL